MRLGVKLKSGRSSEVNPVSEAKVFLGKISTAQGLRNTTQMCRTTLSIY